MSEATDPFEVVEVDVRGVPTKVFAGTPTSLRQIFDGSAVHGPNTFLVFDDTRLTFDDVHRQVRILAAKLTGEWGVRHQRSELARPRRPGVVRPCIHARRMGPPRVPPLAGDRTRRHADDSSDQEGAPAISRSFVDGSSLYTVSELGIERGDLDDLTERAFERF